MKKKGFTLVELMIVVAIIGILAAIAIPSFMAYIKKSKKSEVGMIVNGVFAAEADYNIDNAKFHQFTGADGSGAGAIPWNTGAFSKLTGNKAPGSQGIVANNANAKIIGYVPDGDLFGTFECATKTNVTENLVVFVFQDLDDDNTIGKYEQMIKRDKTGSADAYKDGSLETSVED
ncbi:MAG: prepilin-type N-terminal cleavage/methylation domain-containing protein [Pseudomonadota bacterium]